MILSWNVNGLRAAAKKGLAEKIALLNPDILCLQEIKAYKEQLPLDVADLDGYQSFFFSARRPGYSGVAAYSRLIPCHIQEGQGIEHFDREGRVQILDFKDFLLFNCYFPNGGASPERLAYKMDFYEEVLTWAKAIERPLLICGDVNTAHQEIDLARPKENSRVSGFLPQERAWIDSLIEAGFTDTFRHLYPKEVAYSWWDMKSRARERNVGWRIDYFFANQAALPLIKDAFILQDVQGSDHCPVGVICNS
jgi:exodeoxyribonuclease-3